MMHVFLLYFLLPVCGSRIMLTILPLFAWQVKSLHLKIKW